MAVITYEAVDRGRLVAGHSAGTSYSIEIPLSEWNESVKEQKSVVRSLSGVKHTILHNRIYFYQFKTVSTDNVSTILSLDEFFSSVAGGETFTIDPYGTIATPQTDISLTIDGTHNTQRVNQTEFTYSAKAEAV